MKLKEEIRALSKKYLQEIISIRRHLHANPELSFEERNTAVFIASKLKEYNVEFEGDIAGNGIFAFLRGKNSNKKAVGIRAELDALPIVEHNDVKYKSKTNGVMHACGHDVHMASLLGTARILNEVRQKFEGTVVFIFQPGEEKLPGGASLMIKEGLMKKTALSAIFAQHVMPSIDAGKVGFRSGTYMASADEIYITVKGKGGHAALPDQVVNPILIASHIIVSLQELIESEKDKMPDIPTVLSFGRVVANGATNVIPDKAIVEGTFRTMNEEWRVKAHNKMKRAAKAIAESMGGGCEFNIVNGYPMLINDEKTGARARKSAEEYMGVENVEFLDLRMTSDDFAFFSQQLPACYYRLGIRNGSRGITSGVHTSTFDIDERALETAMGLMSWIVVNELSE